MRRFIALLGVTLIVLGLRLYNNGLLCCGYDGKLFVGEYDVVEIEKPLFISGPHRMDIRGGYEVVDEVINNLGAKKLFSEEVDDMKIIYAYSPRLCSPVEVNGVKVNLMIAYKSGEVVLGTPIIYGSY